MKLPRRCLSVAAALLFLGGCSSDGGNDYARYLKLLRTGLHNSFGDDGITLAQASAIPYASMGVRVDGGRESIIVLATQTGNDLLWTSATHIVLVTQDGRITRTVGLPVELTAMLAQDGRANAAPGQALSGPYMDRRFADFADIGAHNIPIICRGMRKAAEDVTILGKRISAVRVEEQCDASQLKWSFTNTYWVDPQTGFAWRTSQHIHPKGMIIETEIFRPPG